MSSLMLDEKEKLSAITEDILCCVGSPHVSEGACDLSGSVGCLPVFLPGRKRMAEVEYFGKLLYQY